MQKLLLALVAVIALSVFVAGLSVTFWPSAKADDDGSGDVSQPGRDETPVSSPPGAPVITEPPRATLRLADGRELVAGAGTRCWEGMCVDMVGPISNPDAFAMNAGDSLALSFEAGLPSSTSSAWIRVDGQRSELTSSGERLWTSFPALVTPDVQGAPAVELEPGQYIYVVQAFFDGEGDVMYAFYLDVH
ncbi:MAG TPA: hypothetical protein VFY90_13555 [Tepidiformaceae bacterium]|nr:hypothetical protein [Tepidiformaceae bacterium]